MDIKQKHWNFIWRYFIILNIVSNSKSFTLDGNVFKEKLEIILENDLRTNEIQDFFDGLRYIYHPLDGQELINEISGSINKRILEGAEALRMIKEAAESNLTGFTSTEYLQECNKISDGSDIEKKISRKIACITLPRVISENTTYPSMRVTDVMKENSKKREYLKQQLLATEEGMMVIYPSPYVKMSYDFHRKFRQIYSSTVSPTDKDVVIVIDRSGSMAALHGSKTLLQIAIDAVSSVLDTLSQNDRVGIVVFDTATAVPGTAIRKCFATKLAEATPANVRLFQNIIRRIQTGARTNYELALRKAFKFFGNSNYTTGSEKRGQILLFLTDGLPTVGDDPVRTIAEENKRLNNSVVIFTYGIGRSLNITALVILRQMAEQTQSDPRYGVVQKGIFEHIADPSNLRSVMGSYYKRLRKTGPQLSLSLPYYDQSLSGFISSLCKEIHNSHYSLFGVICTDMKLTNVFEEVAFFQHGQNSYAFVIDDKGRTILHPALPKQTINSDFVTVDIGTLERGVSPVIESMKRGESGSKKIYATKVFSRGQVFIDGIYRMKMWSTYYWKPILHTHFSLCVVTVDGDEELEYNTSIPFGDKLHYHGLDIKTHFCGACNHFSRYATKEHSTVFLAPTAFLNPDLYLEKKAIEVLSYIDYLSGKSPYNPGLKATILESVTRTNIAEELWVRFPQHSSIWRYIGMSDGVLRVFPGIKISKNYDYTQRPWYKRALAMRGQTVITGPYLDMWGSGYVITLSKTVHSSTLKNKTFVVGVMAVDVTLTYFYQLLMESYPFCQESSVRCFMMDSSGIITMHGDFVDISTTVPIVQDIHVTQKESGIAQHMLKNGFMNKESCLDIFRMRQHYIFKVRESLDPPVQNTRSFQSHYQLLPISNSNIYLVVEPQSQSFPSSYSQCCANDSAFPANQKCTEFNCQCLCFEEMSTDYCAGHLNIWSGNLSQCIGTRSFKKIESPPQDGGVDDLPLCFDPKCAEKHSRRDCFNTSGCSWCTKSSKFELLLSAYCTLQENCYFGIEGYSLPVQCAQDDCEKHVNHQEIPQEFSNYLIIIPVILTGTLSVICGVMFFIIRWKRKKSYLTSKRIPSGLPVSPDNLPPTENGYTHVVARLHPDNQTSYASRTQFGTVVYHHNFVFDHTF